MKSKKIILIRHGATKGNKEKRYVGRTDEPLLDISREELYGRRDDSVGLVYISPMLRCRQTAALLFPKAEFITIDGLKECDFGDFEYKNYTELDGLAAYQSFIDSGGSTAFPGGESLDDFVLRTMKGFSDIIALESEKDEDIYIVAHGGTQMALMSSLISPHRDYFEWMCKNGEGYVLKCEGKDNYTFCGLYP